MKRLLVIAAAAVLLTALAGGAEERTPVKPSARDKCPVCGMFVAKYPDWTAALVFKDGTKRFFDGPKDLFRFLLAVKQYAPGKDRSDVDRFFVTDYYAVRQIDGAAAFFVRGSDVNGPMGKELIPFEKEAEAREFMMDHGGTKILKYKDMSSAVLKELD